MTCLYHCITNQFCYILQIRRCNLVLSFFDSRGTDPKPCKSNSPSEKADSGIDLSGGRLHLPEEPKSSHDTGGELIGAEHNEPHGAERRESSEDDYNGETSDTETDDETFDEDYFLDVGFGELMLQPSVDENMQQSDPISPVTDVSESSMWCSNLDKFSNILRSSMTNLNTISDNHPKPYRSLKSLGSTENILDHSATIGELVEECPEQFEETSETESQQTTEDRHISEQCVSSEDDDDASYCSKPISKSDMKQYYLSSHNLFNTSE